MNPHASPHFTTVLRTGCCRSVLGRVRAGPRIACASILEKTGLIASSSLVAIRRSFSERLPLICSGLRRARGRTVTLSIRNGLGCYRGYCGGSTADETPAHCQTFSCPSVAYLCYPVGYPRPIVFSHDGASQASPRPRPRRSGLASPQSHDHSLGQQHYRLSPRCKSSDRVLALGDLHGGCTPLPLAVEYPPHHCTT